MVWYRYGRFILRKVIVSHTDSALKAFGNCGWIKFEAVHLFRKSLLPTQRAKYGVSIKWREINFKFYVYRKYS